MNLVFLGPPGAGKGTQAELLSKNLNLVAIAPGTMLRDPELMKTEFGQMAQKIMNSGNLLSDDIINGLVRDRVRQVQESDANSAGFIFDGYPRSAGQAEALGGIAPIDFVIEFNIPEAEIFKRLGGRRVHPASGRTYHVDFKPPKVEGKDDITGEDLVTRKDDSMDAIQQRLRVYREQTEPLIAFYRDLCAQSSSTYIEIAQAGGTESVYQEIEQRLGVG